MLRMTSSGLLQVLQRSSAAFRDKQTAVRYNQPRNGYAKGAARFLSPVGFDSRHLAAFRDPCLSILPAPGVAPGLLCPVRRIDAGRSGSDGDKDTAGAADKPYPRATSCTACTGSCVTG